MVDYGKFIGNSPAMQQVYRIFQQLKNIDAQTLLVCGESGTGKDLAAQTIHGFGPRSKEPFLEIDCASLPDQLVESELFGHEKGSFTDAHHTKKGLFELAKGGTIFLDEIGDMPLGTQAKLLRAIENRRFKRVGGLVDLSLDASLIAATNKNLEELVSRGQFREDLYFRLNILPIFMPPLRERLSDIEPLTHHFIKHFQAQFNCKTKIFTRTAIDSLMQHDWPGNVRELRNLVECTFILHSDADFINVEHLPHRLSPRSRFSGPSASDLRLENTEKDLIQKALLRTNQNQSAAAKLLGISRFALRYRMEKHQISGQKQN